MKILFCFLTMLGIIVASSCSVQSAQPGEKLVLAENGIDYVFRWCPPGRFIMGSSENERGRFVDELSHETELTRGFWLLESEVTQKMFQSVMKKNPSAFSGSGGEKEKVKNIDTADFPVENLLLTEVDEFCKKLGAALKGTVRLPSEAEWEYACRAGAKGPFGVEDEFTNFAWFWDNAGKRTNQVKLKKPNAWGFYDMHGNVSEWCRDTFALDAYQKHSKKDPLETRPAYGNPKIIRGGNWCSGPSVCRSASRDRDGGTVRQDNIGFRIVFIPRFSQGIPDQYRKQWKEYEPEVLQNIEKYRKADAVLNLLNRDGSPLSDCEVNIRQIGHEFKFGCNILVLDQLEDKNEIYERKFLRLFNLATSTLCMKIYHPREDLYLFGEKDQKVWRRPQPDRILRFCQEHRIEMKGQPVIAGSWHPDWVSKDYETAKKQYSKWIQKVAERYDGKIGIIDLVNESLCHQKKEFSLYQPDLNYVEWAFREAKKYFKNSILEINEATGFTVTGPYYRLLKKLFDAGTPIDSIACQYHHFNRESFQRHLDKTRYRKLADAYYRLSEFNRPIYISEITIPATCGADLQEGEAVQAEVLSNLYHLWFSIPQMNGIIYWNFCDGAAWGGETGEGRVRAGLLDENMREKPAYLMLDFLINTKWRTDLQKQKPVAGYVRFRGYRGRYRIEVRKGSRSQFFEMNLTGTGGRFDFKWTALENNLKTNTESVVEKNLKVENK